MRADKEQAMNDKLSRRDMIRVAGAAAAAAGLGSLVGTRASAAALAAEQTPAAAAPGRKRSIRLAHLTDVHVQPERHAGDGLAKCLHHVQSLEDAPSLVITGGDAVMDSFEADNARTQLQWDLWNTTWKRECSLPVEHCIGNHDIWGWSKAHAKTTGSEPNYGKKRAMENYGITAPYRSFDRAGWHFIVLDSVQPDGDSYKALIDDEQFAWLESDLKALDGARPVLVVSHVPIISITPIVGAEAGPRTKWDIGSSLMVLDAIRLKNLFLKHRSVKACISGHIHLVDRCEYEGVAYLCDGAVSGAWWKGKRQECEEGYAVLDLFDDGTVERRYVDYGWTAQP